MLKLVKRRVKKILPYITSLKQKSKISKTRDMPGFSIRDMEKQSFGGKRPIIDSLKCPHCLSSDFVKRGFRKKKHEQVQLYLCKACGKIFTPHRTKGKQYPLSAVLEGLSLYNLGYSLKEACRILNQKNSFRLSPSTIASWTTEFADFCPFMRMRHYALKKYSPQEMIVYATLAHQQLFRYRFHLGKCRLALEDDYRHRRFWPLKEFLALVPEECPHQFFQKGLRASEVPMAFSKTQMIVRSKHNFANQLSQFVLQSVKQRKKRHDALQKFMLYNDSATVATEVPVYLTKDDLLHLQTQLGFELYQKKERDKKTAKGKKVDLRPFKSSHLPRLITGHIDVLQVRNGQVHILDYKPGAKKQRPIEQLTLYALALSRLTGLRMFEFKCAWFDEADYFEFFPLHVVHKPRKKRTRKKIKTSEGVYLVNRLREKMASIKPL